MRVVRLAAPRILVHHLRQQILIERAPVHADAHRLVVVDGDLHDRAKVLIASFAADVARVDAILGQFAGALGIAREQQMAVVVEIADDRDDDSRARNAPSDLGDGGRRLLVVHRHPHQLRPCPRQGDHLLGGRHGIGCVGIGHRLDDDRHRRSDGDSANPGGDGLAARFDRRHEAVFYAGLRECQLKILAGTLGDLRSYLTDFRATATLAVA